MIERLRQQAELSPLESRKFKSFYWDPDTYKKDDVWCTLLHWCVSSKMTPSSYSGYIAHASIKNRNKKLCNYKNFECFKSERKSVNYSTHHFTTIVYNICILFYRTFLQYSSNCGCFDAKEIRVSYLQVLSRFLKLNMLP